MQRLEGKKCTMRKNLSEGRFSGGFFVSSPTKLFRNGRSV